MIVELFAGAGCASVGIHRALPDETVIGVELDGACCATRAAAGLLTIRADVAAYPTAPFVGLVSGVWASPPCPTFSSAGLGAGVLLLSLLADGVRALLRGEDCRVAVIERATMLLEGAYEWEAALAMAAMSALVLEPARWSYDLRPEWIACEQVPAVLPVWEAMASGLRQLGYECWVGVLDCADYGVPQNRKRAILMARHGTRQVLPPYPTHCDQRRSPSLFLAPWVSMADVLGWGMTERPGLTVATGHRDPIGVGGSGARSTIERERIIGTLDRRQNGAPPLSFDRPAPTVTSAAGQYVWVLRTGANSMVTGRTADDVEPYERDTDRPAPTVDTKAVTAWTCERTVQGGSDAISVELHELARLQDFPPDWPFAGNRTQVAKQIGNAAPATLVEAIVGTLTA